MAVNLPDFECVNLSEFPLCWELLVTQIFIFIFLTFFFFFLSKSESFLLDKNKFFIE